MSESGGGGGGNAGGASQGGAPAQGAPAQGGGESAAPTRRRASEFSQFSANSGEFRGRGAAIAAAMPVLQQVGAEPDLAANFLKPQGKTQTKPEGFLSDVDSIGQAYPITHAGYGEAEAVESFDGDVMETPDADAEMRERYEEWKALMEGDDLGEPLLSKFVTATIDGEKVRVPVSEAVKGFMMQNDYTNKLRDVQAMKAEIAQAQGGITNMMNALNGGGERFMHLMEYFGPAAFKSFHEAAMMYGHQLEIEGRMTPEQREVYKHARAQEHKARMLERQNAQLQAQLQARQQAEAPKTNEHLKAQLAQMFPRAADNLKAQGIEWVDDAFSRDVFEKHWAVRTKEVDMASQLSTSLVQDIMQSAAQEIARYRKSVDAQPPKAAALLPGVGQLSGVPGQLPRGPNGQPSRKQRRRISEMAQSFGRTRT